MSLTRDVTSYLILSTKKVLETNNLSNNVCLVGAIGQKKVNGVQIKNDCNFLQQDTHKLSLQTTESIRLNNIINKNTLRKAKETTIKYLYFNTFS